MAKFHDLIAGIKEPGDTEVDPSIYDDLTSEYDSTFNSYTSAVEAREAQIAALNEQVSHLKTQNFDLLMKVDTPTDKVDEVVIDSAPSIDSLFVKKG